MPRIALLAFLALLLLQPLWHGWLHPPRLFPLALVLSLAILPLLPPLVGLWRKRPSAPFWAGLLSLPYFCHGVAEAWASPAERGLAVLESLLALVVVLGVGLQGLRQRRRRRSL